MPLITQSAHIDELLSPWETAIGADLPGYKNHILRVLNFTLWHLGGDETHQRTLEAALVYHDIGLWSDHELAYLEPSSAQALRANSEQNWGLDPALLEGLIVWHHKITPYTGPHADLINALRRADWADFTHGATRGRFALWKGFPKTILLETVDALPWLDFFDSLDRLRANLSGGKLAKFNKLFQK